MLAQVGFKWRTVRHVSLDRTVAAGVIAALAPVAATLPALAALALLAGVMALMIGYETLHYAEYRRDVRREHEQR